jgi:hypothetical protein
MSSNCAEASALGRIGRGNPELGRMSGPSKAHSADASTFNTATSLSAMPMDSW